MIQIVAPMAGCVWKVNVEPGEAVVDGQEVVILESMKMEVPIAAEGAGRVARIHVQGGDFVNEGDPLVTLE